MGRQAKNLNTQRRRFVEGKLQKLRIGGYGGTINLSAYDDGDGEGEGRVVLTRRTNPRLQKTVRPNTREVREQALAAADQLLGTPPTDRSLATGALTTQPSTAPLTVRQAFELYLETRLRLPAEGLDWRRTRVLEHVRSLPAHTRKRRPSTAFVLSVLQSYRRILKIGVVSVDADVGQIQPGELEEYVEAAFALDYSPWTVHTDLARLRTVLSNIRKNWPDRWGARLNPVEELPEIETDDESRQTLELGEVGARLVIDELKERPGSWRGYAAAVIAYETGGRIGSIGANQLDRQDSTPALCANDFVVDESGVMLLRWRPEIVKQPGMAKTLPVTGALRDLVVWLIAEHPNPRGPGYPLLWSPRNPKVSVSYTALSAQLRRALDKVWPALHGEPRPKGVAWHAFIRTIVTTIVDELDVQAAADLTLRTEETIRKYYRKSRQPHLEGLVGKLEEARRRMAEQHGTIHIGSDESTDTEGGAK